MGTVRHAALIVFALLASGYGCSIPLQVEDKPLVGEGPGAFLRQMVTQMKTPAGSRPEPATETRGSPREEAPQVHKEDARPEEASRIRSLQERTRSAQRAEVESSAEPASPPLVARSPSVVSAATAEAPTVIPEAPIPSSPVIAAVPVGPLAVVTMAPAQPPGVVAPGESPAFRIESLTSGEKRIFEQPEYRIGPEDVIRVSVWDNRELTADVTVMPDGVISLQLINDVQAAGLTPAELASLVSGKMRQFIKEPQVSVIVTQVVAPKVSVMGNVLRPGIYPLRQSLTVLHALSLAGGFTPFASPRDIKLIRRAGAGQDTRRINYYRIIEESGEGNYLLKPGDTIVVP